MSQEETSKQEITAEEAANLVEKAAESKEASESKEAAEQPQEASESKETGESEAPDGWAPGAYKRFKEVGEENSRLKSELEKLKKEASKIPEFQEKMERIQKEHSMNTEMMKIGGGFTNEKVQRVARQEYQEFVEESDEDVSFGDWLQSDHAKENPILTHHFPKEEQQKQRNKNLPDPNKGTDQDAGPPTKKFTGKEIRRIRETGQWNKYKEQIMAQLRNEGIIR